MFNTAIISNVATSIVGAAFCSVAALAIAVPSAHAAAPAGFQKAVEASIDNNLRLPVNTDSKGVATVAVSIDGNGSVSDVNIVQSSGHISFDREAIRTAHAVRYPATGKPRTMAMVLGFNQPATSRQVLHGKQLVDAYRTDRRQLLANKTTAQPVG
ncbi:TonB family protein [Sphingomonas paeninsulae]|jgi:TonB family protein|uniref:TonB family protein n=1 Tax=Sphingomonas paeninsulae TaxID=2319844 RepID=A0A494T8N0_SPHPE|nr:energy transducer TonB [Sphingomonas paeninsulae]AYJ85699.1 TonB family protein [Sphingomonas paeninsulae]